MRALVLLVRYTGVRISDAATLARARVREGQIFLHTKKTVGAVFLPIPKILEDALAALPAPRRAAQNPRCYVWNEVSSRSVAVGTAERLYPPPSSAAVFPALARTSSGIRWRRRS